MKVYLVGGAVRDKLLGLPIKEKDWVVVSATPQEMLQLGYKKVGRDFPVFLHPKTHEEYALARTERKTGKGYIEFSCRFDPSITLEEDLKRRDLTINAIAEDKHGKIIDPYHGSKDIKQRLLRHVSLAFSEDPVRILRVARFAARFGNFKVHPKTNKLMQDMLNSGEVDALVPERVWQEFERALSEQHPEKFFVVLKNCLILEKLFPEIAKHITLIKKTLKQVSAISKDTKVRFGSIMFNLDKAEILAFCSKYRVPNAYKELALLVNRLKTEAQKLAKSKDGLVTLLEITDAYRKIDRLESALLACQANDKKFNAITTRLLSVYKTTKNTRLTPKLITKTTDKSKLGKILHQKRVAKIR